MTNTATIIGNLSRAPELRYTPSGAAVANFGVAVNRRWQNRQTQEWEEDVSFFDVVCWRELAENVSESIAKGTRVIVTGRLDQRTWQTDGGDNRSKVEIVADEVAPSLRWATAQVSKNERTDGGGARNEYQDEQAARQFGDAASAAPAGGYDDGEEPFVVDAADWEPGLFGAHPERMLP